MAAAPQKKPTFVTPKGVLRYPRLTKPDYGTEKFPKPDGEYNCQLILDEADAAKLIAKVEDLHREAIREAEERFATLKPAQKKKLGSVTINEIGEAEYDKDTEEETGRRIFKFKAKASGVSRKTGKKWSRNLPLFDGFGRPIKGTLDIGGGSIAKLNFTVGSYFVEGSGAAGITFYLEAAQIIELRTFGERSADQYGFGEEEGGFAYDPSAYSSDDDSDASADEGASTADEDGSEDF